VRVTWECNGGLLNIAAPWALLLCSAGMSESWDWHCSAPGKLSEGAPHSPRQHVVTAHCPIQSCSASTPWSTGSRPLPQLCRSAHTAASRLLRPPLRLPFSCRSARGIGRCCLGCPHSLFCCQLAALSDRGLTFQWSNAQLHNAVFAHISQQSGVDAPLELPAELLLQLQTLAEQSTGDRVRSGWGATCSQS
jgi:hypothetical protein